MELKKNLLQCYEMVCHTTICQEETLEAIVPDACPDILQIVTMCGQVCVLSTSAKEGQGGLTGMVESTVLYCPEGGGTVEKMTVRIPFQCLVDMSDLTADGVVCGTAQLARCEARLLNPRKILVRVEIAICLSGYEPQTVNLCCGVDHHDGMEGRMVGVDCHPIVSVQRKEFTYEEVIGLQGEGLVCSRIFPVCHESKVIGTKLIFKGEIELQILQSLEDGSLSVSRHQLPFSQVMEVEELGEEGCPEVEIVVESYHIHSDYGDDHSVEVSIDLVAQAVVRGKQRVEILEDCYSTTHELEVDYQPISLVTSAERLVAPQAVRKMIETEFPIKTVEDDWVFMGEILKHREGEEMTLTVPLVVTLLAIGEDNELRSVQEVVEVSHTIACPTQCDCICCCTMQGDVYGAPAVGGVELRLNCQFECVLIEKTSVIGVNRVTLGEERERGGTQVILRMASEEESLWEIAKGYGTTMAQIISANEWEEDVPPVGRMLLIPNMK
ncbi:MAG: DUF3794 domain-containing protein [Eubacteriales bacterium]